jgi:hypothetical protein
MSMCADVFLNLSDKHEANTSSGIKRITTPHGTEMEPIRIHTSHWTPFKWVVEKATEPYSTMMAWRPKTPKKMVRKYGLR